MKNLLLYILDYFVDNGWALLLLRIYSHFVQILPLLHSVIPQRWCISMATGNFQNIYIYTISYTEHEHIKNKQE